MFFPHFIRIVVIVVTALGRSATRDEGSNSGQKTEPFKEFVSAHIFPFICSIRLVIHVGRQQPTWQKHLTETLPLLRNLFQDRPGELKVDDRICVKGGRELATKGFSEGARERQAQTAVLAGGAGGVFAP